MALARISDALVSLQRTWERRRFLKATAGILTTPPLRYEIGPPSIVSMVSTADLQPYLLAIKSLVSRLGRARIVCIADAADIARHEAVLTPHLGPIEIVRLRDIDPSPCQRGGCWERLVYVLERSREAYTIQLDSDCLAFGDVAEVRACVDDNRAFVLSNAGSPIDTLRTWAGRARATDSDYIGIRAERLLDRLPTGEHPLYVRASGAFAGFAQGGFERAGLDRFHASMEGLMGEPWSTWGTEQTASNFVIANSPRARVLPHPKFANFWPGVDPERADFLHFFGTHRYRDGIYLDRARQVIGALGVEAMKVVHPGSG